MTLRTSRYLALLAGIGALAATGTDRRDPETQPAKARKWPKGKSERKKAKRKRRALRDGIA